jgi:DNA-binding transcriptional regulator YiaG
LNNFIKRCYLNGVIGKRSSSEDHDRRKISLGQLESTLKNEIRRIAKREVRAVSVPLKREVRSMRIALSNLSKSISTLQRFAKETAKETKPKLQASPEEVKASRLTAGRIRNLRKRLGLSQRELGILTGASLGAVALWEKGKFRPQGEKKAALVGLKSLGKREIKKLLAEKEEPKIESTGKPQVIRRPRKETGKRVTRRRK